MPNDAKRRLSLLDASFLYGESAVNPTHVGAIFMLEGELSFDQVVSHMRQRLHITPRFRQRLAFPPFNLAHATVEDDPDFKLENHVHHHQLPKGISEADAITEILRLHFSRMMDRTRPLWRVTLFEGLPGRSVFVWAMHHAVIDGVAAFEMLNRLMDFTPHPRQGEEETKAPRTPANFPTRQELFVRALTDLTVGQIDSAMRRAQELMRDPTIVIEESQNLVASTRLMGEMAQAPVATPWNAGIAVGERRLAYLKMPFAEYRAIRAAFGGTINDIVLTVLGEGASRYLQHHKWPTQGIFRFGCPVNVRRPGEQIVLENRVSMMTPTTSAAPMDIVERLKLITQETKRIKESGAPYTMERMSSMAEAVPPAILGTISEIGSFGMELMGELLKAFDWKPTPGGPAMPPSGISFVATNVPGPQAPWYFAGHKVTDMIGLLPLGGNLGYGVSITSYDQHIIFSMMADARMMPDVEQMKIFVQEAFDELRQRVPVELRHSSVARAPAKAAA
jgi:diacylglycerol O-acyltransferase / wax synthase